MGWPFLLGVGAADASYFRDVVLIAMNYSWSMHLFFEISDRLRCIWRDGCIAFWRKTFDWDAFGELYASFYLWFHKNRMHGTLFMHRFLEISGLLRCIWTLLNWFLILQPLFFIGMLLICLIPMIDQTRACLKSRKIFHIDTNFRQLCRNRKIHNMKDYIV